MPRDIENKYGLMDEEEEALAVHPDFARRYQQVSDSYKVQQRGLASNIEESIEQEKARKAENRMVEEQLLFALKNSARQNYLKALQGGQVVDEETLSKYDLYPTTSPRFGAIRQSLGKK